MHTDQSRHQSGLLVSNYAGTGWYRVSGTSMAAAVLTRHLYEHLAGGGTAASFIPPPYCYDETEDLLAAGEPPAALPAFRGIWKRFVPCKDNGSF